MIECNLTKEELIDECLRLWEGIDYLMRYPSTDIGVNVKYGWRVSECLQRDKFVAEGGADILYQDVCEQKHIDDFVPDSMKDKIATLPPRDFFWKRLEEELDEIARREKARWESVRKETEE